MSNQLEQEYWMPTSGYYSYTKTKGVLKGDGAFYPTGFKVAMMMPYVLNENIFENEIDCVEFVLEDKKQQITNLRLQIDKLEERKSEIISEGFEKLKRTRQANENVETKNT